MISAPRRPLAGRDALSPDETASAKSTALARAARRERQAAELLGTKRVRRSRYEKAPDTEPVTLPCRVTLQPEVKTRKRLPALVTKALDQARAYGPRGSVPVAVLSATGGEPLIALPLRAFRRIAGLETEDDAAQLAIPLPPPAPAGDP